MVAVIFKSCNGEDLPFDAKETQRGKQIEMEDGMTQEGPVLSHEFKHKPFPLQKKI